MRTVSSKVSKREHAGILEYANQTGETISNVLKKAVFERAAKSKTKGCPDGYRLNRRLHEGLEEESLSAIFILKPRCVPTRNLLKTAYSIFGLFELATQYHLYSVPF